MKNPEITASPVSTSPVITMEQRAEKIFEAFTAEHPVPDYLHEDLQDEIIMALECYGEEFGVGPIRQSEAYHYMEGYLVRWVGDQVDSRRVTAGDMLNWGMWSPDQFADSGDRRQMMHERDRVSIHINVY